MFIADIDLNIFLNFNKIRKLHCTPDDIRKAISKSELIELSDNKDKIRRKIPIKVKENEDECTIYVENIKADDNHETLSHIFSGFGNVVYVSIPKYKHTKSNKGFAFVEFKTEKEAQNALDYFENIGCKMPLETNPEDLVSIKTFEDDKTINKEENGKGGDKNKTDIDMDITTNEPKAETEEMVVSSENSKKRKLGEEHDKQNKKLKMESKLESSDKNEKSKKAIIVKEDDKNDRHDKITETEDAEIKKKIKLESELEASDKNKSEKAILEKEDGKNDRHDNIVETDDAEIKKKLKIESELEASDKNEKPEEAILDKQDDKSDRHDKIAETEDAETKKKKKHKKDKKKAHIKELGIKILSK